MSDQLNKVKIKFEVPPSKYEDYIEETVWAEPLGDHKYKILNSPFFAFGYSYLDIVTAEKKDDDFPLVIRVDKKSGHSTYRLKLFYDINDSLFLEYWRELESIGCTYENANGKLITVDVPQKTDIYKVYSLLEEGEQNGIWDFQEADCAHTL